MTFVNYYSRYWGAHSIFSYDYYDHDVMHIQFYFYNSFIHSQNGANVHSKNRDNLTPLDLVKDTNGDLADLLRGEPALLDAAKKGEIDRVSCNTCPHVDVHV